MNGSQPYQTTLRIGFIGRFDSKKNLDLLVQALPPNAQLHIAGAGTNEVRSTAITLAQTREVADRVIWYGFVCGERKERFFSQIDVLVMPSEFEAFGVAAAEAMARRLPVVVSRTSGLASLVMDYECGIVVEPTVEALHRALAKPNLLEKGNAARTAVERELRVERHGERLRELYAAVADC